MTKEEIIEYIENTPPSSLYNTRYFKDVILPYIIEHTPTHTNDLRPKEILVWFLDGLMEFPTCCVHGCDNRTSIKKGSYKHYSRACSSKCSGKLTTQERTKLEIANISAKRSSTMMNHTEQQKQQIRARKVKTFFSNDQTEAQKQREKTCMEKYGVKNPMMNKEISARSKSNKTTSNADMVEAMRNTCMERYGQPHYNNPDKISETNKIVWASGTELRIAQENSYSTAEAYIAHKKTILQRYGVDNISKIPAVQEKKLKTSYKSKDYMLPSGKIIKVQGYEPKLLDELLMEYSEDEILTSPMDMPTIEYIGEDNCIHTYFPDVFIPSTNTVYEVKSSYTLEADKEKNERKFKATKELGYNFELKVY